MSSRTLLKTTVAIAALVGLVLAWPVIAGTVHKPRMGDWVPEDDPGVIVTFVHRGRTEVVSLGELYEAIDFDSSATVYAGVNSISYVEDGTKIGRQHESGAGTVDTSFQEPQHQSHFAIGGGYTGGKHLEVTARLTDGTTSTIVVAGPPEITPGATTTWATLAAFPELGVLIEWSQTPTHILLRRGPMPDAPKPKWDGGGFHVQEAGTQFSSDGDHEIARMLRARIPSLTGVTHVSVRAIETDDGINTDVFVR